MKCGSNHRGGSSRSGDDYAVSLQSSEILRVTGQVDHTQEGGRTPVDHGFIQDVVYTFHTYICTFIQTKQCRLLFYTYICMYMCIYVHTYICTSVPMAVLFRRTVHSKRIRKVSSADFSVNKRSIYFCIQHKQLIKLLSKLKQNRTKQNKITARKVTDIYMYVSI